MAEGLGWVEAPSRLCDLEWTMDLQSEFTLIKVDIPWSNPEFIDDINTNDNDTAFSAMSMDHWRVIR